MAIVQAQPAIDLRASRQFLQKSITADGSAGNGAVGTVTVATIAGGAVIVNYIAGRVTSNLTGATSTLALGVTNQTTLFIGATTATTMLTTADLWVSTTATQSGIALPSAVKDILISTNIIITVGTANWTGGTLILDMIWEPLTQGATLT